MKLEWLSGCYTVCQLDALPSGEWLNRATLSQNENQAAGLFFLARTDEEISLVCLAGSEPAHAKAFETGWRAFRVAGPLDFGLVGILARLSRTLAEAGISIFAVSTYRTDYILVRQERLEAAEKALVADGWQFAAPGSGNPE